MTVTKSRSDLQTTIRANVKRLLAKGGQSQADIARHLGCTRAQVTYLMHAERRFSLDYVEHLAAFFGVSPWELLVPPQQPPKKSKKS